MQVSTFKRKTFFIISSLESSFLSLQVLDLSFLSLYLTSIRTLIIVLIVRDDCVIRSIVLNASCLIGGDSFIENFSLFSLSYRGDNLFSVSFVCSHRSLLLTMTSLK